jgi:transposase
VLAGGAVQLDLFNEAEVDLPKDIAPVIEADESISIPAHTRKKSGRKALPKSLPRVQVMHDLTDAEKICACGSP